MTDDELTCDGIRAGWLPIARAAAIAVEANGGEVVQVKQKMGALCVYYRPQHAGTDAAIALARSLCARTCELCGEPGALRNSGGYLWVGCGRCSLTPSDTPAR